MNDPKSIKAQRRESISGRIAILQEHIRTFEKTLEEKPASLERPIIKASLAALRAEVSKHGRELEALDRTI